MKCKSLFIKYIFPPQISVQKQISQYFRNQRRTSKALGTSGPDRGNPTSKKARVSVSEEDDEIAQRQKFELLSTAEEGTLSSATYSNLERDTFQMRRKLMTQEANLSKEILNVCPYLGKPSHVS